MDQTYMKERQILPLLLSMALPMIISMTVNSLYNIVDSYFVAKISEDSMTALSLVFPIQNLINAMMIGFTVGINAVISYHLGAREPKNANIAATLGFFLNAVHGIVLTVVCIFIMPTFLAMFTSDATVIDLGVRYARVAFLFTVFNSFAMSFEKIYQAIGQMTMTMVGIMIGCVTNIILDPLMIFGIGFFPYMGIEGAALATGIGQTLSFVFYVINYMAKPIPVKLGRTYLVPHKNMIKKLYSIGIPATLNLALPSLLISSLNIILAAYSQVYIVILGAYYKLQTFLYLSANGIIQGMRPLIGYNYGAKEMKRVRKIYATTLSLIVVIMVVGTVLCWVIPGKLIGLFTTNLQTIEAGITTLRIISVGFLFSTVSVSSSGALEGLGKGVESLVVTSLRYVIIIIPAAYILSRFFEAIGVWCAFPVAEVVTAIISYRLMRRTVFREYDHD